MRLSLVVDAPQAALHLAQGFAQGGGDLVETYHAVQETCLGHELLEVGRYGGTCGQHHAVGHRRRRQAEARQGPVDDSQTASHLFELTHLTAQHPCRGGAAEQHLAAHQHACRHQRPKGRTAAVDMLYHRHCLPLEVVLFRGDETRALVDGHLGLRGGEHAVHLLAVYTYRCHTHRHLHLVEPSQDIVEAHRLAGVLLEPHYRQAAVFQYIIYEWHRGGFILSVLRNSRHFYGCFTVFSVEMA